MSRLSCIVASAYAYVHAHGDAETPQAERNHYKNTLHSGEGLRAVTWVFWGNDVSDEGTVSLPACLPPQEFLPEKQTPNATQRQ